MANELEIAKAKEEITKSIRDLLSFKITLPLGNPNFKLIHTNKFITTVMPDDFALANFGVMGQKLNSSDTRFSGYTANKWYVEAVTITNDGSNAKMELDLNPFASSVAEYKDAYQGFVNAYTQAVNNANKNTTSTKKTTTKAVKTAKKVDINKAINEVGKLMEKKKYRRGTYSDYKNFVKYGYGDCWAGAYFVACQLQKRGVTARIINYSTLRFGSSGSANHRSVQYKNSKNKWVNFPYEKFNINKNFKAYASKGKVIKNNCPKNL